MARLWPDTARYRVLTTRYRVPVPRYRVLTTRYRVPDRVLDLQTALGPSICTRDTLDTAITGARRGARREVYPLGGTLGGPGRPWEP